MHNALDRYFPEFLDIFKDWTGKAALHLLKRGYLSEAIRETLEEDLLHEVKRAAKRGVGIKCIQDLKWAAKDSVGFTVGLRMGRQGIHLFHAHEEGLLALEASD